MRPWRPCFPLLFRVRFFVLGISAAKSGVCDHRLFKGGFYCGRVGEKRRLDDSAPAVMTVSTGLKHGRLNGRQILDFRSTFVVWVFTEVI